jgi:hypothetical protein
VDGGIVALKRGNILCYFCLKQICYILTSVSHFKAWFGVGTLRVEKGFDEHALNFQIKL